MRKKDRTLNAGPLGPGAIQHNLGGVGVIAHAGRLTIEVNPITDNFKKATCLGRAALYMPSASATTKP
eukprot:15111583-Heterocapsa_arctica.AAC.1